jgi:hypothetical protein
MFVLIRKGSSSTQRRIDQRHVNFLVRSLHSKSLFESQRNGTRCIASHSILDDPLSRNQQDSQTTKARKSDDVSSILPTSITKSQSPALYKSHDAMDSLRNTIISSSSRDVAWNLVRSTMTSPSAYRTIVYEPVDALLGLPFYGARNRTYQYNSRAYFSSKASKAAKVPIPKSPTQTSLSPFASIDPQALYEELST